MAYSILPIEAQKSTIGAAYAANKFGFVSSFEFEDSSR
jgi:hypothetical protein